ncbi:MAG: DUF6498-containing protein [Candidatus Omnitrophica bacterium]|nr:DUF6498-containing protein [Candidatus Omnitrophota bacterium]
MKRSASKIFLIAANCTPILGVLCFNWQLFPLLMGYWLETGIIGLFAFLRMIKINSSEFQNRAYIIVSAFAVLQMCGAFMFGHFIGIMAIFSILPGGNGWTGLNMLSRSFHEIAIIGISLFIGHALSYLSEYKRKESIDKLMIVDALCKRIIIMQGVLILGAVILAISKSPVYLSVIFIMIKIIFENFGGRFLMKTKWLANRKPFPIILLLFVFILAGPSFAAQRCSDTAIIVLGTRELDQTTPSLDMSRRVEKGVELYAKHPSALLIFTGGKTSGPVSEAAMMAELAVKLGVHPGEFILEEESHSTKENAQFTANLVLGCAIKRTMIVTRLGHLKRATRIFFKYRVFGKIQPVTSNISKKEIIRNLQEYLAGHQSVPVQQILEKIKKE